MKPVIAVDFGTATTFDCISGRGEYMGGMRSFPGIHVSMEALFERASSMLHRVEIARPQEQVIGKHDDRGAAVGAALRLRRAGRLDRRSAIRHELGSERCTTSSRRAAWRGASPLESSVAFARVEPFLTLDGLRILFEKNRTDRSSGGGDSKGEIVLGNVDVSKTA